MNDSRIYVDGIIKKVHKSKKYEIELEEYKGHIILATPSGKMRIQKITLNAGDCVKVELSKYDLTKGRIIWRN